MKIKNCFFALSATALLLPLAACNKSSVTWDVTEEKLEKVQQLDAHIINSTTDLSFTLSKDNLTFNPDTFSKDAIVLLADFDNPNNLSLSVTDNSEESKYNIDVNKLLANRFTDFICSLSKDNKTITITIPEQYKNGTFSAFVNDKVTSSGNFAESSQIFIPIETEEALMFQEDYCNYFLGQKNPCFYFSIHKANSLYDKEKITFGGDFENLIVDDIIDEEHEDHYDITLITKGSVKSDTNKNSSGTVTFESGFVDNLKSDATFAYEVATGNAYVDPTYIQRNDAEKEMTIYVAFSHNVGSNMTFEIVKKEEKADEDAPISVSKATVDPESDNSGYYVTLKYTKDSFKEAMAELRNSSMKVTESDSKSNDTNNGISYEVTMDFAVPEFYVTLDVGEDGYYCFDVELRGGFINNSSDSLNITKNNIEFVRGLDGEYSPTFTRENITKIEKIYHHNVNYGFEISTNVKYEKKHDYISGNLVISKDETAEESAEPSIKYHSTCDEEYEAKNLALPYSFETLEIYKQANGRNTFNKYNAKKDPTAEYYSTVMQPDDFCWQYGVKAGISGIVLGGLAGAAFNGSGDAAATLVGLGLEIIDGLLDASMGYDPVQQLFDALTTITLQLNEISKNLQEMRSEMHEMHEEVYNGISSLNFIHEQTAWTDFCKKYLEQFDTTKLRLRTAIKSKIYKLFNGSSNQINLDLNYGDLTDTRTAEAKYASLLPSYVTKNGQVISTDRIAIDAARKIAITIDSSKFINTKTSLQNGYNRDFIKNFRLDLKNAIVKAIQAPDHEFDSALGLTISNDSKNSFKNYYDYCHKATTNKSNVTVSADDNLINSFASDIVKTLLDQGIKDYFSQDKQSEAVKIAEQACACFKVIDGEIGVGAEKQYEHFYKMMYGKYSFQNEAIPSIRKFRMWLKQTMFSYASIAKTGLDVYNNSDTMALTDNLKEYYQRAIKDFCDNDGLKDVKKNVYDKNPKVFSADYCYVTNSFVTMGILKNRTTDYHTSAKKPKNSNVGISSQNWVYEKKNSIGVYRKLNDSQGEAACLPYVSSLKMKHIVDRARYNGNLKDEKGLPITVEQYFLKYGVLANMVRDEHNEHDPNHTYLINEYSGAYTVGSGRAKDYNRNVTVYCHTKLEKGMHYFEINGGYNINKDPHDKESKYGSIYKTHAKVWDINNNSAWQTPDRDNLGHVYWHFQSHWYWSTDEIWGFQEFTAPTYYYTFLKC